MLNDLLDKVHFVLDDACHACPMLRITSRCSKQSLEDQLAQGNETLEEATTDSSAEGVWPLWRRHRPQAGTVVLEWLRITRLSSKLLSRGCLTHDHPDRESCALRVATLHRGWTVIDLEMLNPVNP